MRTDKIQELTVVEDNHITTIKMHTRYRYSDIQDLIDKNNLVKSQ